MERPRMRGTTPEIEKRARSLRREMTQAELVLWGELRGHKLAGLGFRRQHPILRFVVDFYCPAKRLCVEVDGGVHDGEDQSTRDTARTAVLEAGGHRVLRFRNEEVLSDLPRVLAKIQATAAEIA